MGVSVCVGGGGEYVGEFVNIDRCITCLPTFSEGRSNARVI